MNSISTLTEQCTVKPELFSANLLSWYDKHRRDLPWRAKPDETPAPYRVWLSEIMLQQTTVAAVIPYFHKFTDKWPTVQSLADAPNEEIMSDWAGLGYYARARNLHKCAKVITDEFKGVFPDNYKDLKSLPGIGDYTASAITAIAFNKPANVVDGNVERVMARLHTVDTPLPSGKAVLKEHAEEHAHHTHGRHGDYAQALMDLGATICTPKSPKCPMCPVQKHCKAYVQGNQEDYPKKSPKQLKPTRYGYVYWVTMPNGNVLIHNRPASGLLGGMTGLPTSDWETDISAVEHLGIFNKAYIPDNEVTKIKHVFTHFNLYLSLHRIQTDTFKPPENYKWIEQDKIPNIGLPSVFSKARSFILGK